MTQNQEPQEKQIADKRNPEQTPLPPDIDVLRTACPGLQDAWNIFQGNPKMSAELKELVQQYLKTHPDAIDPVTHKIHAEDMKKLVEQLHKRDRTFELVAINNRMVGLHDRLVARQQLEKLPVGKERTEAEAKLKESHAYESLWLFAPRLIRRCLQTMDRYVVLRNRYNYPGLVRNAKLETSVSTQITQLSDLMQRRIKMGRGDPGLDIALNNILATLPMDVGELYMDFTDRALQRNAALFREGRDANPTLFPRLEGDQAELVLEQNSFQLNIGMDMIGDLECLTTPDARFNLDQPLAPLGDQPFFPWQSNTQANEKFAKATLGNISENFRRHFDDVLGRRRDGQPPRTQQGLLEVNWKMQVERGFTAMRPLAIRMYNGLLLYRGAVQYGVREGVRIPLRAVFGLVPGGESAVDALISPAQAPTKYQQEHIRPVLEALGLPENFDFSQEAFKKLEADPIASKRYRDKMTGVATVIEESRKGVQESINRFEGDLAILTALQGKYSREHLANADIDEAWIKAHPVPPGVTMAEIQALQPEQGAQILAAHAVLFRQMRGNWTDYSSRMNLMAERILGNVQGHLKMEQGLKEIGQKLGAEDEATFDWMKFLIIAGISYYVSAQTLGRLGRLGGFWGTGEAGGLLRSSGTSRFLLYGRYNPLAIINGATRVTGMGYLRNSGVTGDPQSPSRGPTNNTNTGTNGLRSRQASNARVNKLFAENPNFMTEMLNHRGAAIERQLFRNPTYRNLLRQNAGRLTGSTAPASLEGIRLNATALRELHAFCQLRIETAARALGVANLTTGQARALLEAHYAVTALEKRAVLSAVFTNQQVHTLVHRNLSLAGTPPAVSRIAGQAGSRSMMGSSGNFVRGLTRALPSLPPNAARFIRGGGRLLGPAAILWNAYQEETNIRASQEHVKACRAALEADIKASFPAAHFEQDRRNPNVYIHKATRTQFDVSALLKASGDLARYVDADAFISRGATLAACATLAVSFVPAAAALIVIICAVKFINEVREGFRRSDLRNLFQNTPVEILALVDATNLTGMGYGTLMSELGTTYMGRHLSPNEIQTSVRESINNYKTSFLLREVRALCAEQGIPQNVLVSGTQSLTQFIQEQSGPFMFRGNYYNSKEGREHIRSDVQQFLARLMVISLLRKREQLQTHLAAQGGPNRLTQAQERILRAEIAFLEQQPGGTMGTEDNSLRTIGDLLAVAAAQDPPARFLRQDPSRLLTRDLDGDFYGSDRIVTPDPQINLICTRAEEMLTRLGATRVISRLVRQNGYTRESIAIDDPAAVRWEGTTSYRLSRGGSTLYIAMVGNNLMWSTSSIPGWQRLNSGDCGDAWMNGITRALARMTDNIDARADYDYHENEGIRVLLSAGAAPTRITATGTEVPPMPGVVISPDGNLDAYVVNHESNGTTHRATFFWAGTDWYWFTPENTTWTRAELPVPSGGNPILNTIIPQLAGVRDVSKMDAGERAKSARAITNAATERPENVITGCLMDMTTREELFGDWIDQPDVYVAPASVDGSPAATLAWASQEPYADMIAMMTDEVAPQPYGRFEGRTHVLQVRRMVTTESGGTNETILVNSIRAEGHDFDSLPPEFKGCLYIAMTRRVTDPPSTFRMGAPGYMGLGEAEPRMKTVRADAERLLEVRWRDRRGREEKTRVEQARKDLGETGLLYMAITRLSDEPLDISPNHNGTRYALRVGTDLVIVELNQRRQVTASRIFRGVIQPSESAQLLEKRLQAAVENFATGRGISVQEAERSHQKELTHLRWRVRASFGYEMEQKFLKNLEDKFFQEAIKQYSSEQELKKLGLEYIVKDLRTQARAKAEAELRERSIKSRNAPFNEDLASPTKMEKEHIAQLDAVLQGVRKANSGELLQPGGLQGEGSEAIIKIVLTRLNASIDTVGELRAMVQTALQNPSIPGQIDPTVNLGLLTDEIIEAYRAHCEQLEKTGTVPPVDTPAYRSQLQKALIHVLHDPTAFQQPGAINLQNREVFVADVIQHLPDPGFVPPTIQPGPEPIPPPPGPAPIHPASPIGS